MKHPMNPGGNTPLIDQATRQEIVGVASWLATNPADAELVRMTAQALAAWVVGGTDDKRVIKMRQHALSQQRHNVNLAMVRNPGTVPMPGIEEFLASAETLCSALADPLD